MALLQTNIADASSILLRFTTYSFLRWVLHPYFPPIIFALFLVYVPAFISSYVNEPKYWVVDEIDIVAELKEGNDSTQNGNSAAAENGNGQAVEGEVAVAEEVSLEQRPIGALRTLLLGSPSPRSLLLSATTFLVNALCVGMVADRLYREHSQTHISNDLSFARLGYVSDAEAKLLIREPDQAKMPVTIEIHMKDPASSFDNPYWQQAGRILQTTNETDYTAVFTIPLRQSKQHVYEWRTSNNHTGEFNTPPKAGHAPEGNNGKFTFLSTSCIVSRLPYNPLDHPLAIPGLRHLARVLPTLQAQFMLFLGDFIYVDVPRYWGKDAEDYRAKYRQVYASPDWAAVGQNLSWIHVLDDHEILNDWSSNTTGIYAKAIDPWNHYHKVSNPPLAKREGASVARQGASYFSFTQGPASFFLLDTRTYRSDNKLPADDSGKTMLGAEQLKDFIYWLQEPETKGVKWKIVASSVPFTKNWPINTQDTWGGFLAERREVLEAMWDAAARGVGVIVLSGDRHEFAATKFPPPPDSRWPESATVHEFSVSPLSQFYSPVPSYKQVDEEDILIKYVYKGNSKFGAITIEPPNQNGESTLKYSLFVDGVEIWDTAVLSPSLSTPEKKKTGGSFWDRINSFL